MSKQVLYRWPPAAKFGRVIPKTKFYEHSKVTAKVRDKFVIEVKRITWAYKLADETIHLRCDAVVPEIQVFVIDAKEDDVSEAVLTAIDKAVLFPIIFEINREHGDLAQTRTVACHKQLGGSKPMLSGYFSTEWLAKDADRVRLPAALDLPSLYSGLIAPILPISMRSGERLPEAAARLEQSRRLEREMATLERRLRTEPQLNRKVELRRMLRDRNETLTALTDAVRLMAKDYSEKDS